MRSPFPQYEARDRTAGAARGPEPRPEPRPPDKPDWLTPHASELWDRLVPQLVELEVLTHLDGEALSCLCETYATLRQARETVAREGVTFTPSSGLVKRHPA